MRPTTTKNKESDAIRIALLEFESRGGEIQEIPIGVSAETLRYKSKGTRYHNANTVSRPFHIKGSRE